ncbi:hypothetical protein [Pedobacter panaciterrae]|jgi:hypothetical protein|uniref:hypothetical protein n=1 Tax=Pedobacter panaciterrae TaxID=363849 RepID=UPI002597540B|nr:hypothetical protein [uncultured Pedobacter sp.]
MKSVSKNLSLVLSVLALTVLFSCKKKEGGSPVNSDEEAAKRVVGTYKGTLDATQEYFNAIIVITKENGNKVKITPKQGEPYSNVTPKIITVKAIQNSDDAEAIGTPEGTLVYQHSVKNISIVTLSSSSSDVTYNFRGTKQ